MRPVWLTISLVLGGCASIPGAHESPSPDPVEIDGSPEAVFSAVETVYGRLGFEDTTSDTAALGVEVVRLVPLWKPWIGPAASPLVRCTVTSTLTPVSRIATRRRDGSIAHPERIPPAHVTFTIATSVRSEGGITSVETRISAVPVVEDEQSARTYCVSTGRLEARIAEMLREDFAAEAPDGA